MGSKLLTCAIEKKPKMFSKYLVVFSASDVASYGWHAAFMLDQMFFFFCINTVGLKK